MYFKFFQLKTETPLNNAGGTLFFAHLCSHRHFTFRGWRVGPFEISSGNNTFWSMFCHTE
jgi:hypothetical protein